MSVLRREKSKDSISRSREWISLLHRQRGRTERQGSVCFHPLLRLRHRRFTKCRKRSKGHNTGMEYKKRCFHRAVHLKAGKRGIFSEKDDNYNGTGIGIGVGTYFIILQPIGKSVVQSVKRGRQFQCGAAADGHKLHRRRRSVPDDRQNVDHGRYGR